MKVSDILEITSPVDINHMIILTTVNSSSLAYWLPSLLNAQCELHYFALVFLQLILDCHFSKFSTRSGRWCGSLRQSETAEGCVSFQVPAERQRLQSEKSNARYPCDNCHNKDIHTPSQPQSFECSWIYPCGKKEIPEIPQTIIPGKKKAAGPDPGPRHCTERIEQRQGTPDGERADLLGAVHLSEYLTIPWETNQEILLQWSAAWV